MKISLILAHPDPASFNHAIADAANEELSRLGHEVRFHDLYAEGFDPLLPREEFPANASLDDSISLHCRELAEADGIVVVHPNWWGMPPAVMKGWIDRVVRPEVAYRFLETDSGEGVPEGLLRAKAAVVFNTANTPAERETNVFGDPLERIWKDCIFDLCGVKRFYRRMFRIICTSTQEERVAWLEEVRRTMRERFGNAGTP